MLLGKNRIDLKQPATNYVLFPELPCLVVIIFILRLFTFISWQHGIFPKNISFLLYFKTKFLHPNISNVKPIILH